jgi:signal transduction histidine kinase/DNA-binding response OmpR family regulator
MSKKLSDDSVSILIVDDRPDKVLALESVLEELGQRIERAYSGREALRQVLNHEFAVILLDVNMPDMDGFETASLIRQRRSSRDTPIIFVTAYGDEMHAARGYSLGAVDYILAPVMPDVLRTKVAVFADLFRKTRQLRQQTETLGRRANQQQKLAAASLAINSGATSTEAMLQTVTDAARDIVGTHQAITLLFGDVNVKAGGPPGALAVSSFSDKYAEWRERPLRLDGVARSIVAQSRTATRLSETELREHADWQIVQNADFPGIRGGMLAAPLTGRDGKNLGVIYLSDRSEGEFSRDDEAVLVQLAQMTSIAVENELFAREREANRLKDEFLATLSHELRTPLSAIFGWAQLLKRRKPGAEIEHGLEVIERNVKSQLKLIEDLLDVSRITAGKLRLQCRELSVRPIITAAVDAMRPSAEAAGVTVSAAADDASSDVVIGDADRLQQVIWNLLSNAVKFTPAGGRVDLQMRSDATQMVIAVTDTGRGIHQSFLPHVFDRFRQADSSSTRSHSGLGIGLAIVRHIVELHGGTVTAQSGGEGAGSTFSVILPLHIAGAQTGRLNGTGHSTTAHDPSSSLPPALSGARLLLVEDMDDTREVLSRVLDAAGATVTAVDSAPEAMLAFAAGQFDMLVSDIGMPGEDGVGLIQRIRELPRDRGGCIPAIALTAYARDEDRSRILAAGFQGHLAKPIEPDVLIRMVGRYMHVRDGTSLSEEMPAAQEPAEPADAAPRHRGFIE